MDDGHGGGQPNQRANHSRPFFYVQPPSQPYHHQPYPHWHLSNPYNHYGLPAGYPYGRPYMPPYPYMQYPGYVMPHGPVYPMDYRRFEPQGYPPAGQDVMYRQHHQQHQQQQQQHQAYFRREMACSEAQTDTSDALNKIIESLEKLRANERACEKELDSGIASQTSGIDERKLEEEGATGLIPSGATLEGGHLQSPATLFSDSSNMAVYDDESSRSRLKNLALQGECWPQDSDEELPLDSSSVHEDNHKPQLQGDEDQPGHHCPPEKLGLFAAQSDGPQPQNMDSQSEDGRANQDATCIAEGLLKQSNGANLSPPLLPQALEDERYEDQISKIEYHRESTDHMGLHTINAALAYQILRLPFENILTAGTLQGDNSLLCSRPQSALSAGRISSPVDPYYLNYWSPPVAHERMSILSPSVDELSSRDEMFSTDLDDMDLFPKRAYASRRLPEVGGGGGELLPAADGAWPKRPMCTCCGVSLSERPGKGHGLMVYGDDEEGESDEERKFRRGPEHAPRPATKTHSKKSHSLYHRHGSKHLRGYYSQEAPGAADQQDERELYKVHHPPEGESGQHVGDRQYRAYQGTSSEGRGQYPDVQPRRKTQATLQGQDKRLGQRKAPLVYHRSCEEENEEAEPPRCHRGKRMPQ